MDRVSVVIPSLERGALLLETIEALRALDAPADEIIIVDQSVAHPADIAARLESLHASGAVVWARREERSIPAAMNHGVAAASGEVIVFLDDDVRLRGEFIAAHRAAHEAGDVAIVAGRILQPWHVDGECDAPLQGKVPDRIALHATEPGVVRRFGAGNVSIRRDWLLRTGGFDENFRGAAYRFEADFAARVEEAGGRIVFEPRACIDHLHASSGGTRVTGGPLTGPWHSAGRWYYLLRHPDTPGLIGITLAEMARAVLARRHLRAPWRAAAAMIAESRGMIEALHALVRGPRLGLSKEPR